MTGSPQSNAAPAEKIGTGIPGFDDMTCGGLPRGRITAVIGAAGAGKTVFAMQTLFNLVRTPGGAGVVVTFEQSPQSLLADFSTFGWDAASMVANNRLHIIDGRPDVDMVLAGSFDIDGLLAAIGSIPVDGNLGCVVLDGIDALLGLLPTRAAQRQELLRLQDRAARLATTVILTIKAGYDPASGFEDMALHIADCVIELSRDTEDGVSIRSIKVQKLRGSNHMLSRQPFLVTALGFEVEGIESTPTYATASTERLPIGVPLLDEMLGGGFFRGSSTLISGAPGTAKTTLGLQFLSQACARGEPALFVGFDETPGEVIRNAASVGIDLPSHLASGMLQIQRIANRATGPDELSYEISSFIERHAPRHLMIDPISVFSTALRAQNAVYRIVQLCKLRGITALLTSLIDRAGSEIEATRSHISALCDTWIHLNYLVNGGERNRALTIVKSRGTRHSNQVAEMILSNDGIQIADVYTEDGAVLMGSLRWQRERASQQAIKKSAEAAASHYRTVEHAAEEISRRIASLSTELRERNRELEHLRRDATEIKQQEAARREGVVRLRGSFARASDP